ncbi:MAG: Pycsar system effector family protein [Saprospiraceae bacterium]
MIEAAALNVILTVKEVETYVIQLLNDRLPGNIYFHNVAHTLKVKEKAIKLAKLEKVSKEERLVLAIAALFHDTGFINTYEGHENESQNIAVAYLREKGYPEDKITKIKELIKITDPSIAPASLLEKIICDADTIHVGQKKYRTCSEALRKEWEVNKEDFYPTDLQWEEENLSFLQKHTFYTKAAKENYQGRKSKNINKTKVRVQEARKIAEKKLDEFSVAKNKAALTMFKTSLRNHIDLTAIADNKSNIMLSVNALLLTIGMPIFASYLSDKLYLLAPSIIFMFTCITTMVFATLSTRPIKMDGKTNLTKIPAGKTNLFFFGNFYNIGLNMYQEEIKKVISNKEQLDTSIINDLYYLGHSLGDKFRYLRICYNVFIVGIGLSLIAFLVSFWMGT